ncbi:alpha/beta fold hydrolase [Kitasatospora sp. NPDC096204]|uniref:alpha/beta fold hydrolase n=1 Tax=Kitasatospora sp. NPDC096204 TaxID=3364094 RepID=UPI0037FBF889
MNTSQGERGAPAGPRLRRIQEAIARALGAHLPGGVRTGELDRGGRTLRWVEAGRGGVAPVGLIAGCGSTAPGWSAVPPELVRCGRDAAYDRAGLGASEPEHATVPTSDGQLADLDALVRHLNAGPAILVGHSWGGRPARLLAWRRPEPVAGLVLVDPAYEEFQPRSVRVAEAALTRPWLCRAALPRAVPSRNALYRAALSRKALSRAALSPTAIEPDEPLDRAETAVIAHRHQRRAILAEQRLTATAVPEIRRHRAEAPPRPRCRRRS